jgi:SPP1 family predicted phage head-tail adaptor
MDIGRLDRKIYIEDYTDSVNSFGERVKVWATYVQCFASKTKSGGNERLEQGRTTATNKVKFKIRYYSGITEDMRIRENYRGTERYYDIHEIQELGREGLWITATAKL